jgi:hypothetical protein
MTRVLFALSLALVATGCASSTRFANRPILWRDLDDAPIPMPRSQSAGIQWTGLRDAVLFPADRALALDYGNEAVNVNALDETPDSTWYLDRRRLGPAEGYAPRAFSAVEIARGDGGDDLAPEPPLLIIKGKTIGSTPGLVVLDARDRRYLLKLDPPGWRGMNTSTEVVAARLAWAAGWLVPQEMIVDLRPEDLALSPKARSKTAMDVEIPLTPALLADLLARTPRGADGTIRVAASRWLNGTNLGSFAYTGRRSDDPNDRIDHENRRDVRGFGVFAAWINDIDTMENNTMDAYVGAPGRGHVIHYQQDVGGSFGQFAAVPAELWMGDETYFMPGRIVTSFLTFGFTVRPWQNDERVARRDWLMKTYPELGYFDDVGFDPRDWHPVLDNPAFVRQTARDRYWGAKRVVAFSESELRAAVALGHYAPATAERLYQILWNRRQAIARAFLGEVAPLDYFRVERGERLCFDDLWLRAGLGEARATEYSVDGEAAATRRLAAAGATSCVALAPRRGYQVVTLGARRGAERRPAQLVRVHLVDEDGSGARIVGLER